MSRMADEKLEELIEEYTAKFVDVLRYVDWCREHVDKVDPAWAFLNIRWLIAGFGPESLRAVLVWILTEAPIEEVSLVCQYVEQSFVYKYPNHYWSFHLVAKDDPKMAEIWESELPPNFKPVNEAITLVESPKERIRCKVHSLVGKNCLTAEDGQIVHDWILPKLVAGIITELDFEGVEVCGSTFFRVAIGQLLKEFSPSELNELLHFFNLPRFQRQTLKMVIEHSKEYYSKWEEQDE